MKGNEDEQVHGGGSGAAQRPPRVFISYSHDSEAHKLAALNLAQVLRRNGIDATIDRFVQAPREGWTRWMRDQVETADFVLAVCTPTYKARFEGNDGEPNVGRGANWEGFLTEQWLYDHKALNKRVFALLLGTCTYDDIPYVLRAYSHFRVAQDITPLLRLIWDEPEITPDPIGQRPELRGESALRPTTTAPVAARVPLGERPVASAGAPGNADSREPIESAPIRQAPTAIEEFRSPLPESSPDASRTEIPGEPANDAQHNNRNVRSSWHLVALAVTAAAVAFLLFFLFGESLKPSVGTTRASRPQASSLSTIWNTTDGETQEPLSIAVSVPPEVQIKAKDNYLYVFRLNESGEVDAKGFIRISRGQLQADGFSGQTEPKIFAKYGAVLTAQKIVVSKRLP